MTFATRCYTLLYFQPGNIRPIFLSHTRRPLFLQGKGGALLTTIPTPVPPTTKEVSFLLNKLIAHSMYGDEVRGLLRVLFELSANVCDVALRRV